MNKFALSVQHLQLHLVNIGIHHYGILIGIDQHRKLPVLTIRLMI